MLQRIVKDQVVRMMRPRSAGFVLMLLAGTLVYAVYCRLTASDVGNGWHFFEQITAAMPAVAAFAVLIADLKLPELRSGNVVWLRSRAKTGTMMMKYIAALIGGLVLYLAFGGGSLLIGGLLFGFGGYGEMYVYYDGAGIAQQMGLAQHALLGYGLQAVTLVMMVTLAFMLATWMRCWLAKGLAITVMLAGHVAVWSLPSAWVRYTLFANNLNQYFEGPPPAAGMTITFSLGVMAVYFLAFQLIAWLVLERKRVKHILLIRWPYGVDEEERVSS